MLAEQRKNVILQELSIRKTVAISQLCVMTGASETTIRRDLSQLEQQGKLHKIFGGATLMDVEDSELYDHPVDRSQVQVSEKELIARYAAGLIQDNDVVYLDSGSTVMLMAEFLQKSQAMFITNSIECACRLMWYRLQTRVIGGTLNPGAVSLVGAEALAALGRYNFTKTYLGVDGMTIRQGYTVADPEAAAVKALAASRSLETWVLADSSKFGRVTAATIFSLDKAILVTDRLDDPAYREYTQVCVVR